MSPLLDAAADGRNSTLEAAIAEAHAGYAAMRPRSAQLHTEALATLPGGNTRSNLFYRPFPTAMAGGEGCHVTDVDGRTYLDLCGEYTAGLFGHSCPGIQAALHAAIDQGIGLAAVGENEARFSRLVCARFPAIDQIRFTNSGTEANLLALALARNHTGRGGVLAFRGGYHGSLLTFVAGAAMNAPLPVTLADYNDLAGTVALLHEHRETIGAVIIEPMQGSGGCIPAQRDFLSGLRQVTSDLGMLLIFDEVMTSRHTAGGLQQLHGVLPDLTTLGKYLAGGMGIGAFGGKASVMAAFDATRGGALTHSGTFNNNVLSMAGGVAAMEMFDAAAADALFARGESLRSGLNAICARHSVALQFTGLGSMLQPHFRTGPIIRAVPASAREDGLRELFFFDMLASGVALARRGMAALSLPVGDAHCQRFAAAVEEFCASRAALIQDAA